MASFIKTFLLASTCWTMAACSVVKKMFKKKEWSKNVKIVVVGDAGVGKTALFLKYTCDAMPRDYIPTVFDVYRQDQMVDGVPFNFGCFDTAGHEDYERLRPLSYPITDIFFFVYSVIDPSSLSRIRDWVAEIKIYRPFNDSNLTMILIGAHCDIRDDKTLTIQQQELLDAKKRRYGEAIWKPLSTALGQEMAKEFKMPFFEISSLSGEVRSHNSRTTKESLTYLFAEAVREKWYPERAMLKLNFRIAFGIKCDFSAFKTHKDNKGVRSLPRNVIRIIDSFVPVNGDRLQDCLPKSERQKDKKCIIS